MSLFARAVAWAREGGWVVTTEDDDQAGATGQALLEAPEEHPSRRVWPTAVDMPIVLFVPDDGQRVVVYSLLVEEVDAPRRAAVLELTARANHGLLGGAFEIDVDEGDVRFRSDLDLASAALDDEQLGALLTPLLEVNLETVEVYAEALGSVLAGRQAPQAAVESAEEAIQGAVADDSDGSR
jgi:hypothetical protein